MNKVLKGLYEIGVDVDGSLERFGYNERIYLKFLEKFVDEPSFINLGQNLKDAQIDNAIILTCSIKGMACTLGFNKLADLCNGIYHSLISHRLNLYSLYFAAEWEYNKIKNTITL
jgi:HPt (histidine-containing phosphotransfer) domain-containing protein